MATWLEKLRKIDQRNKEQEKLAREMTHRPQADIESLRGQDPLTDWGLGVRERTLSPLATLAGEAKRFQGLSPQEMGMEMVGGGMAGNIKKFGKLGKKEFFPSEYADLKNYGAFPNKSEHYDALGNIYQDMSAQVIPLKNGEYVATVNAPWGSKSKNIYAVGDDPEELAKFILDKKNRSDKAIQNFSQKKQDESLGGMLKKEFGDIFNFAKSQRSESQYITHNPSGEKIRISGHKLPLAYEGASLDIPIGLSDSEKFNLIKKHLYASETPIENQIVRMSDLAR